MTKFFFISPIKITYYDIMTNFYKFIDHFINTYLNKF